MKKIIIAAFALSFAGAMLGAGAAEALTIGIHTDGRGHYRNHRHQVCNWHHHHRSCYWR